MINKVGLAKSEHVARSLEREIRQGRIAHGEQLESENSLMNRFSVSRNTVRKGLETLARQGLITTRTGIGSFVTYDGTTIDSNLGWTTALARGPDKIETRLISLHRGPCAKADRFLKISGDYLCVDRVRYCLESNQGITLEWSRLPWRQSFADVLQLELSGGSLNRTLIDLGLHTHSGEEVASVLTELSKSDARLMERRSGDPMLKLQRCTRAADGTTIEYIESILDPERFGLRLAF